MRKQCVPGSFFSAHAQEPGNEAKSRHTSYIEKGIVTLQPLTEPASNPDFLFQQELTRGFATHKLLVLDFDLQFFE